MEETWNLEAAQAFDVLVLGSGIAGISAAAAALEAGKSVALACKGRLFSGSSFYPGTWGLGLIGPENEDDQEDLVQTILRVGCGMAREELVRTFVAGIAPAIARVEAMGVRLRKAQSGSSQQEYIPCFDHKHRSWNGIEFASARQVFGKKLEAVTLLEGWEALELTKAQGRVCGAVLSNGQALRYVPANAVVLATGGYGSLFSHHLCTTDVEGSGQGLALDAGCHLGNMEFMQIMPGYLFPAYGTVFNEKAFRFSHLEADGTPILADRPELFRQRSGHGPFTSRLASREIDLAICGQSNGVTVRYDPALSRNPPEFVKTYFDWLREARGLTPEDPVQIGLFSHAANGGVQIDGRAFTGVPGLYAAGEVTGGMHGADRIGGLSTANGLVFGTKAGKSAAEAPAFSAPERRGISNLGLPDSRGHFLRLQALMTENAMAVRTEEGLSKALCEVQKMRQLPLRPLDSLEKLTASLRLSAQLKTAEAILSAQLLRQESRGSHYRADYPRENPACGRRILISETSGELTAAFEP